MSKIESSVAIVGAGPNGLAAAGLCRELGIDFIQFGEPMDSWKNHMPKGMLLRSSVPSSSIGSPSSEFSIRRYQDEIGRDLPNPLPIQDFIDYGLWVQRNVSPDIDNRYVEKISYDGDFKLSIEDGDSLTARKVVLALGINQFANIPKEFEEIPECLAAHSSKISSFDELRAKRVVVIGAGQSAQESAALLNESGAEVELISKSDRLIKIAEGKDLGELIKERLPRALGELIYPPTGLEWLWPPAHVMVSYPEIYKYVPGKRQRELTQAVLRPRGSHWLTPRLESVTITNSRFVTKAEPSSDGLKLQLSDDTSRTVDFVLLATGYRPDITKEKVLEDDLLAKVNRVSGYPTLRNYQTSVDGLFILGALAARDHGPINRFVSGSLNLSRMLTPALIKS